MIEVQTLLSRCRELGAELTPTPHGTLKVKAPAPLPEALWESLKQHKNEVLELLRQSQAWLCPHCGRPVTIEGVFPSQDGERTLTMWKCDPCQTVAVTPDAIRTPPVWVKKSVQ